VKPSRGQAYSQRIAIRWPLAGVGKLSDHGTTERRERPMRQILPFLGPVGATSHPRRPSRKCAENHTYTERIVVGETTFTQRGDGLNRKRRCPLS